MVVAPPAVPAEAKIQSLKSALFGEPLTGFQQLNGFALALFWVCCLCHVVIQEDLTALFAQKMKIAQFRPQLRPSRPARRVGLLPTTPRAAPAGRLRETRWSTRSFAWVIAYHTSLRWSRPKWTRTFFITPPAMADRALVSRVTPDPRVQSSRILARSGRRSVRSAMLRIFAAGGDLVRSVVFHLRLSARRFRKAGPAQAGEPYPRASASPSAQG